MKDASARGGPGPTDGEAAAGGSAALKRPKPVVRCIIFDLDGTLVDSEAISNRAFLELLPDLEDTVDGLVARYRGKRLAAILAHLAERLGRDLPADFERLYRARVAELFDSDLAAVHGAADMLRALPHPLCIASNGPLEKIRHALEVTALGSFFGDNLFSAYEVGVWKPDPGLFLHAAEAMGVAPGECAVVEDSFLGAEAALAAGMTAYQYCPGDGEPIHPHAIVLTKLGDLSAALGAPVP